MFDIEMNKNGFFGTIFEPDFAVLNSRA